MAALPMPILLLPFEEGGPTYHIPQSCQPAPFVMSQPKLASNRQIKAVRQLVSDIHKKAVGSRTKEEAILKQVVSIVLPNATSSYTPDVRQWFTYTRTQVDPPNLFDAAWIRYQHAVHLETRYPSMDAMKFGCRLDLPHLITAQLKAGYGVNAFIEVTDPVSKQKRLTYPVIEASTRFHALKALFNPKANIYIQSPDGETLLSTAVARVKRAQSTSIQHRNSGMDMDLTYGPSALNCSWDSAVSGASYRMTRWCVILRKNLHESAGRESASW